MKIIYSSDEGEEPKNRKCFLGSHPWGNVLLMQSTFTGAYDSFSLELTFFKRPLSVSPVIAPIQLPSFSLLNPRSKILRSVQSSESHHSRGLPHFPVLQIKTLQCWTLSGKFSNCLMWYLRSLSCELAQFSRFILPSALIPPQLPYTAQAFFLRAL